MKGTITRVALEAGAVALVATLGTVAIPAQAAGNGTTIQLVKGDPPRPATMAIKDQAKAKFKGTPVTTASNGVTASPNSVEVKPPSGPVDPGPPPTTVVLPESYYRGLSTEPYPAFDEVADNNGQACVALQQGFYWQDPRISHLGVCEDTSAQAQIIGPNGQRHAWGGLRHLHPAPDDAAGPAE